MNAGSRRAKLREALELARLAVGEEEFHREDGDRLARLVLELGAQLLTEQDRALDFITVTLDAMHARPRMWGGMEAIELQYLELLTLWVFLQCTIATPPTMQEARLEVSAEYQRLARDLCGEYNARPLSARGVSLEEMLGILAALRKKITEPD